MPIKTSKKPALDKRTPRQDRALHKVELILEATMRLIDQGGIESLTTNAVAQTAGVSIGTLYQYFHDKQAILDALATRELGGMSAKVVEAVTASADEPGARIRGVVRAVMNAYGGRKRVHRRLIQHSLSREAGTRLHPLYARLTEMFTANGIAVAGHAPTALTPAQAFVMTHAVAGVMRALINSAGSGIARTEIEDALTQMLTNFMEH
jgi:AcrR family transcriptional regulator